LLAALFHFEFHDELDALKEAYAPINPDRDRRGPPPTEAEQEVCGKEVRGVLAEVLGKGNYRELGQEELDHALGARSLFPIDVHLDFDDFADFVLFARGESMRREEVPRWFGLSKIAVDVATFDRVCLFIRFKPAGTDVQRRAVMMTEGSAVLKLFRNIPKADLEMLFPNIELRMRTSDKLLLGVPAVVGGVPVLIKLAPALIALAILFGLQSGEINTAALVAGLSGLLGLGLFLFRQWDKWKSRKVLFLKMLSENLYFRNIDNNEGVLTRLIDEAEEEEHKEALLGYHFLRKSDGLSEDDLDRAVESWLEERFGVRVDFEVDDALGKLERLGLATRGDDGLVRVVAVERALELLDKRWDELFDYNHGQRDG
jgi:hypothetical protein